jgi:glycosyltransferase involved in cell wall biosynthesis
MLTSLIAALHNRTSCSFDLVVCDDGSTDDTLQHFAADGVKVIGGTNRGIAWNKNRGLFYLREILACDIIILLDDDVLPVRHGWEQEWIEATIRYGHINFPPFGTPIFSGSNLATDPGLSTKLGGVCLAFSREALSYVGYFDPRFKGYGHEHTDLTLRAIRAGFGGFIYSDSNSSYPCFLSIDGGLVLLSSRSHYDETSVTDNQVVLEKSALQDIYRLPWRNHEEYEIFRSEIEGRNSDQSDEGFLRKFNPENYLKAHADVASANIDAWTHFKEFGWSEKRQFS